MTVSIQVYHIQITLQPALNWTIEWTIQFYRGSFLIIATDVEERSTSQLRLISGALHGFQWKNKSIGGWGPIRISLILVWWMKEDLRDDIDILKGSVAVCSRHTESESSCIHILQCICVCACLWVLCMYYICEWLCGVSCIFNGGPRHRFSREGRANGTSPTHFVFYVGRYRGFVVCALSEQKPAIMLHSWYLTYLRAGCFTNVLMQKMVFDCIFHRVKEKRKEKVHIFMSVCCHLQMYVVLDYPCSLVTSLFSKRTKKCSLVLPVPLLKYCLLPACLPACLPWSASPWPVGALQYSWSLLSREMSTRKPGE